MPAEFFLCEVTSLQPDCLQRSERIAGLLQRPRGLRRLDDVTHTYTHTHTHTHTHTQHNTTIQLLSLGKLQTSRWMFRAVGPHQYSAAQENQTTQVHAIPTLTGPFNLIPLPLLTTPTPLYNIYTHNHKLSCTHSSHSSSLDHSLKESTDTCTN